MTTKGDLLGVMTQPMRFSDWWGRIILGSTKSTATVPTDNNLHL